MVDKKGSHCVKNHTEKRTKDEAVAGGLMSFRHLVNKASGVSLSYLALLVLLVRLVRLVRQVGQVRQVRLVGLVGQV